MNQIDKNQPAAVRPIDQLFRKDVNRVEFLSIVGLGALSLIGLGPLIHFLTGKSNKGTLSQGDEGTGPYSTHPYGA